MKIICSIRSVFDGVNRRDYQWPTIQTACVVTNDIANIACGLLKASSPITFCVNIPARVVSIAHVLKYKESHRIIFFNVAALIATLLPYGPFIAIGIDTFSEIINFNEKRKKENPFLPKTSTKEDLTNLEAAYRLLNIQNRDISIETVIVEKNRLVGEIEQKKAKASLPLATEFQRWIDDVKIACETVCASKRSLQNLQ